MGVVGGPSLTDALVVLYFLFSELQVDISVTVLSILGGGAISRVFTTKCKALKIEKLKAPLLRGPEGEGETNDWCIMGTLCRYI